MYGAISIIVYSGVYYIYRCTIYEQSTKERERKYIETTMLYIHRIKSVLFLEYDMLRSISNSSKTRKKINVKGCFF